MYVKEHHLKDMNNLLNSSLICKPWIFNNTSYKIIKYDKTKLTYDLYNSVGIFRSLVMYNDKVLSFSPVKTLNPNIFMSMYKETECIAEEFIEGTMINLFFDPENNKWEISTKSSVGANIKYFKDQPTFRKLFYDICETLNIDFSVLSPEYCYSFIMQHPENKFVIPIAEKKLYLISIYKIDNENSIVREIPKTEYVNITLPTTISYPYGHYFTSYEKMINAYGSMNTSIYVMGIVIKHISGDRTKIRNPAYEYVKQLKGNNTKIQYQYLCLNKENKLNEYLSFYPEKRKEFSVFKKNLYNFTNTLYLNYINCYIKKLQELKEFPYQYRTHMYALHQCYLQIKDDGGYINKNRVIKYINELDPARLMYSLNYHLRELKHEKIISMETDITT